MRNKILTSVSLLLCLSCAQANEKGNGGNAVALEFLQSLSNALSEIQSSDPQLAGKINETALLDAGKDANIVVVDTPLVVSIRGLNQPCVATNDPQSSLIQINQSQWNAIGDSHIKEGIALHEVLSLEGLEDTGNYPLSSQYVSQFGLDSSVIITVPVPTGMNDFAVIRVNNVAQPRFDGGGFNLTYCKTDAQGNLLNSGCDTILTQNFSTNTDIKLPPGLYLLSFGQVSKFVNLLLGQQTVIDLKAIEIPAGALEEKVQVFLDTTQPSEQALFAKSVFAISPPSHYACAYESNDAEGPYAAMKCDEQSEMEVGGYWCDNPAPQDSGQSDRDAMCKAYSSTDFNDQLKTFYEFMPDGLITATVSDWRYRDEGTQKMLSERNSVRASAGSFDLMPGSASEYVEVLPGTYMLQFTDPTTNQIRNTFGISVQ
jgi:hypothetical protein